MTGKPRVPNWLSAKVNFALIFATLAALLLVAGLVTAFAIDPPAPGWVGFAIASAVVVVLSAAATLVIPRMRVSPQRPALAVDPDRRLLVVADAHCNETALADAIQSRLDGAVAVHLVVPIRVSHLRFLTNDESEERRIAQRTMSIAVRLLRRRGISARGSVGTDKPLESMTDALGAFSATDVLLAVPPEHGSYWLERDLLTKARALTEVPVTQAIVASAQPAGSTRRDPSRAERTRTHGRKGEPHENRGKHI